MSETIPRIKSPEALKRLGMRLRQRREQLKLTQGKVPGMRQATVSKMENGGDVTLDTLVSYAAALGLELSLVPIGQAAAFEATLSAQPSRPLDLLSAFDDLKDSA
jgi:transcriptional regulator with XRE-family HTH domain